jgi:hypothetical protein
MPRPHRTALAILLLSVAACEPPRPTAAPTSGVTSSQATTLKAVRAAGYFGPVGLAEVTAVDSRGTRPTTQRIFLPNEGLDAIQRAAPASRHRIMASIVSGATDPNEIDPDHNGRPADVFFIVEPSRLTGRNPVQTLVTYRLRFFSYDPITDQDYNIQSGEVMRTYITARDSSSGHFHGSVDTSERHLPLRVGTLDPDVGSISSGLFTTVWHVSQSSNEISLAMQIREIGGPGDGNVGWFFSFPNDAARYQGLTRLPANTARYSRLGGTAIHPEDFNDWGTADLVTRIQNVAETYFQRTADKTRVNDMSLFFGGRFDIGRTIGTTFNSCGDGASAAFCWQFSHAEHRLGTEVDINPEGRSDPRLRAIFYASLLGEFRSVYVEGNHFHARVAASPYNR